MVKTNHLHYQGVRFLFSLNSEWLAQQSEFELPNCGPHKLFQIAFQPQTQDLSVIGHCYKNIHLLK